MATKTIPAQEIVTCDICGVVCNKGYGSQGSRRMEAKLIIQSHVLDQYGDPAAGGNSSFDLCDACFSKVRAAINEASETLRRDAAARAVGA